MIIQVSVVLNRTAVVSVDNNSPILDYVYLDEHTQPTYEMTSGFKFFTVYLLIVYLNHW